MGCTSYHGAPLHPFASMPESVFDEIFGFLSFVERRNLVAVCSSLWQLRKSLEGKIKRLRLDNDDLQTLNKILVQNFVVSSDLFRVSDGFKFQCLRNYSLLETLDLDPFDFGEHFFEALPLLPSLKCINLRGHPTLNDQHLYGLQGATEQLPALESLDIAFCLNATFEATFSLRDAYPKLKLIRRQPKWLDGHFVTPFGSWGEMHTYWPDGQFKFSRSMQSCGFSCDTKALDADGNFVRRTLRYNDFTPHQHWPAWTRFVYKPGISLLKLDDEPSSKIEGEIVHSVLVAQYLTGTRQVPTDRSLMEKAKALVPLGESRYFDKLGNIIPEEEGISRVGLIMISRMQTIPFESDEEICSGPPLDVLDANRRFCAERSYVTNLEGLEETFYSVLEAR